MSQNKFEILSDRDHILLRPQMYIGSTSPETIAQVVNYQYQELNVVPGLLKIINEIIDNSVDEAIRTNFKFANKIKVDIKKDESGVWLVMVEDNGRGIPSVQYEGIYQAEASWTRAKAGTSFNDDRTTIGANGVGSFATNCFSLYFHGSSCDGEKTVDVICQMNCHPDKIRTNVINKKSHTGTKVIFEPDLERFHIKDINEDHLYYIKDRLTNIQICYPQIKFTFNNEQIKIGSINDVAKQVNENSLPINVNDNIKIVISTSGSDQEFRFISYLNGLNLKNGGTHIDTFINKLSDELRPLLKKKYKIDVLPNQIKQNLFLGIWCNGFVNPKFDSQSKERLTNTSAEINSFFKDIEYDKIAKKLIINENIILPIVENILYKKEQQERKAARDALKKTAKIKSDKYVAATSKNTQDRNITLGEGLSSLSTHIAVRNPATDGSYALKGKVLNTNGIKKEEIAHNVELAELMGILGLNLYDKSINDEPTSLYKVIEMDDEYYIGKQDLLFDKPFNEYKTEKVVITDKILKHYKNQKNTVRQTGESVLNYGKIRIMTDMDPDGFAIECLLLQFFSMWPDLFLQKRIVRLMTPLVIAFKKNERKYLYSFQEIDEFKEKNKGYEYKYIKGLGSLNSSDYKEVVITNPKEVVITLDELYEENLNKAFGNDVGLRKEWLI